MKKQQTIYIISIIILLLAGLSGFYKDHTILEEPPVEEPMSSIVPYENLFRQYAPQIGWPWQLLAALSYQESRWNPNAQSASGAKGLMQLMPRTGERFSLNDSTFCLPEDNIRAGIEYIKHLQHTFSFITDSAENQHFVLASYNAGPAHIMDARRLAKHHGYSPYHWFNHTEHWLEQLQYPETIADTTLVHYGIFNPQETISHVKNTMHTYNRLLQQSHTEQQ